MTIPIKTQCPHCQTCFNIQQTQLNKANTTVTCEHCQQSFLVNEHLIVSPDTSQSLSKVTTTDTSTPPAHTHNKNQNKSSDLKPSSNKQHAKNSSSDTLIHDDLIHDDMDIDDPSENILEYDSLDSMDAWLTQASHTSTPSSDPLTSPSKATNKNSRSSIKSSSTTSELSSTAPPILSSVAANDIHASVGQTTDNSWLEQLLKEQNKQEDTPQDNTDLSQLLLDMGVPLKNENYTSEGHVRKSHAQTRSVPTSEKQSIASILWTLGCLVLALLLFAQYIIFNLENLVKNPAYAQRLQAICSVAACSLPSADLTAFTVTTPNHRSSQINGTGTFSDVSATLNNQSAKAQLYPNLKVSVYGANDMIGEFIAAPEDYLLSKQSHLAADSDRQLLFTIPVANTQIREITISPLY